MSDKKSTKAEVATNSQTTIKSSEGGDKEKTPIIDTPLVEDIAKESAEDSIHNEAISEIENTLEDSTKVAVEIDENSDLAQEIILSFKKQNRIPSILKPG